MKCEWWNDLLLPTLISTAQWWMMGDSCCRGDPRARWSTDGRMLDRIERALDDPKSQIPLALKPARHVSESKSPVFQNNTNALPPPSAIDRAWRTVGSTSGTYVRQDIAFLLGGQSHVNPFSVHRLRLTNGCSVSVGQVYHPEPLLFVCFLVVVNHVEERRTKTWVSTEATLHLKLFLASGNYFLFPWKHLVDVQDFPNAHSMSWVLQLG